MTKKRVIILLDILLAVYVVFAMTSFNNPDELNPVCTQVSINIADESTYGFLNVNEIKAILERRSLYPINKPMKEVNPRDIEELLTSSAFVNTAECYKTKDGIVKITITQRSPIIRIKNNLGDDYYIDEKGGVMPKTNYTSDLIVATGNISNAYARDYLSVLANTLMDNELWRNQVVQINILDDGGVELVPRVGDHIIFLGYLPEHKDKKERDEAIVAFINKQLTRIEKFYKHGLSYAGWNRYEYIDVQYGNQIICRKQGAEMARIEQEKIAKAEEERLESLEANKKTEAEKKPEAEKKTDDKKSDSNKDVKKEPAKKSETKKPEPKKTDAKKSEPKKTDVKKSEPKKTDSKKTDTKKKDSKKK